MNPQDKELLEKTYELANDNNKILHGIRRSNRWNAFFRVVYWIIIIGVSVGAFYYVQPYLNAAIKAFGTIQTDINSVKTVTNKISGSTK
jgi:hypothetical protein